MALDHDIHREVAEHKLANLGELISRKEDETAYDLVCQLLTQYPVDLRLHAYLRLLETLLLEQYLNTFKSLQRVPQVSQQVKETMTELNLSSHEAYILTQIDGVTSIKSLIYIGGLGKFNTLRILARFMEQNLITVPQ